MFDGVFAIDVVAVNVLSDANYTVKQPCSNHERWSLALNSNGQDSRATEYLTLETANNKSFNLTRSYLLLSSIFALNQTLHLSDQLFELLCSSIPLLHGTNIL